MIQVLSRAFDIFEKMVSEPEKAFSSTELAEHLNVSNTTCNNILRTMLLRNYLEQEGVRGGYRLGPMAARLGHGYKYQNRLIDISRPFSENFTRNTNESCNLVILRNCHRFILYSVKCSQDIQAENEIRPDANLYVSATARTLMAYASKDELKAIIEKNGEPSKENWPEAAGQLEEELANIRAKGYGIAHQDNLAVSGAACPVYMNDKVIGVLGYWLPAFRHTMERRKSLISELKLQSKNISYKLSTLNNRK